MRLEYDKCSPLLEPYYILVIILVIMEWDSPTSIHTIP